MKKGAADVFIRRSDCLIYFCQVTYHRRYEKTLKYYATVWARGQKEKWPMYREVHGNADRAVEFYLEAARRAPELRKRILWKTRVSGKEA